MTMIDQIINVFSQTKEGFFVLGLFLGGTIVWNFCQRTIIKMLDNSIKYFKDQARKKEEECAENQKRLESQIKTLYEELMKK